MFYQLGKPSLSYFRQNSNTLFPTPQEITAQPIISLSPCSTYEISNITQSHVKATKLLPK